jgi:hypothetical protein
MGDSLHTEWWCLRWSGELLRSREVDIDEQNTRVDLFKLSKGTMRCGCDNAVVVRGDGTEDGTDEREAWFGK